MMGILPRGAPLSPLEAAMVVCWSSGFIGGLLAAETGSVFGVLFWRFAILAGLLLPFAGVALARVPIRVLAVPAVTGALAMFGYIACVIGAIVLGVPAGTVALIAALQPLTTAAVAGVALGETVTARQWSGLGLGLAGVLLAVSGDLGAAPVVAYGLAFLSMVCLVAATVTTKAAESRTCLPTIGLMPQLAVQSTMAALLFLPLALIDGGAWPEPTVAFGKAVLWFIGLSTLGGFGLYWVCLKRTTATRVASLIYLTPPVTAVWAAVMFGQPITVQAIAGFGVCLAGVGLARPRAAATRPAY